MVPKTPSFPPFPVLKKLHLQLNQNTLSFNFLAKKFFRNKLHTLEVITLNFRTPKEDVGEILKNINRIASPSKLEVVEITIEGQEEVQDEQDPDILPHTIVPLLPFHNLRHILLYPNFYVDLDNQAIEMMAHSWPNLVEFDIGWADLWVSQPREINIVVNATVPIPTEILQKVEHNNRQSPVRTLNVTRSPIRDMERDAELVASFLKTLFPKLSHLNWVKSGGTLFDFSVMWGWGRVEKMMGIGPRTGSDTGADESEEEESEVEEEEEDESKGDEEAEEEEREERLGLLELD